MVDVYVVVGSGGALGSQLATSLAKVGKPLVRLSASRLASLDGPEFYDAVAESHDAIELGAAAKVLNNGIGRNRLFETLRERKILMENNQPYQRYIDEGWFRVVEQKFTKPDGSTHIHIKPLVYQKGLNGIRRIITAETAR